MEEIEGDLKNIGVVGDEEFTLGFRLAGVHYIYNAKNEGELITMVQTAMSEKDLGVLVLTQDDFDKLPVILQNTLYESISPTVITLGGSDDDLREKIKRSVGVDLWK